MRIIFWILMAIIILTGIIFACLNAELVVLHYIVGTSHLPLSMLLVITLFLGCIIGWIVGIPKYVKQKNLIRQIQKKLDLAEKELDNLRTMPYKESI